MFEATTERRETGAALGMISRGVALVSPDGRIRVTAAYEPPTDTQLPVELLLIGQAVRSGRNVTATGDAFTVRLGATAPFHLGPWNGERID